MTGKDFIAQQTAKELFVFNQCITEIEQLLVADKHAERTILKIVDCINRLNKETGRIASW